MINCPHCGERIFDEPEGFDKLSPQQAALYRLFVERPKRIWTTAAIADRLWHLDPEGGPANARSVIQIQIMRIRKRLGNVIETTRSGYRLRLPNSFAMVAGEATENGT